jgi:cytochrome b involved in lipid metabolism
MNISKELQIGSIILVIFVAIVVIMMPNINKNKQVTYPQINSSAKVSPTPIVSGKIFSLADVSKHNSLGDCWLVISGNVYNATDYLYIHPGGAEMIVPYCGSDATDAFLGMMKHDSRAQRDLATIFIGKLN